MKRKLLSIVIPVYMNASSLYATYIKLLSVAKNKHIVEKYDYEFIFINDGSTDNSLEELRKIKGIDISVKIIDLTKNFGQVSAIFAGLECAKGDFVINISADLQDSTKYIYKMIKKWEEGYKVVACTRIEREDGLFPKISSFIFYRLVNHLFKKMPKGGFDYFLLDKIVYQRLFSLNERNSFIQADILWFGYKPFFIKYRREKRKFGKSQWTFGKKLKYFIDGVFNTSYIPIRLMSLCGLMVAFVGFLYSIVVFFLRIFKGTPFPGYAPIMMCLLVFSGLIMLMLGVIGEYLWRVYDEVRKRPRYIVDRIY